MESALERLIAAVDDGLPSGPWYHRDLVNRAAAPMPDFRPALISRRTAALLHKLRSFRYVFRHVYEEYDYDLAAENVSLAIELTDRFRRDIIEAGRVLGLVTD